MLLLTRLTGSKPTMCKFCRKSNCNKVLHICSKQQVVLTEHTWGVDQNKVYNFVFEMTLMVYVKILILSQLFCTDERKNEMGSNTVFMLGRWQYYTHKSDSKHSPLSPSYLSFIWHTHTHTHTHTPTDGRAETGLISRQRSTRRRHLVSIQYLLNFNSKLLISSKRSDRLWKH